MMEWIVGLPLWQMIRYLGIASYVLLAAGICLGIAYSFPVWKGVRKAQLYKLHTFCTIGGTALGLLHGVITVIDTYLPYSWTEVLVPFAAKQHPVLNGLGTLAGYGMLLVILTSDLRNKIGKRVWKLVHFLSYPIFVIAFVHGYFLGTDTALTGIRWMYLLSFAAVVLLTVLRVTTASRTDYMGTPRPHPAVRRGSGRLR